MQQSQQAAEDLTKVSTELTELARQYRI